MTGGQMTGGLGEEGRRAGTPLLTDLEFLHGVTVQGQVSHALTVLEGDIVHQPQG